MTQAKFCLMLKNGLKESEAEELIQTISRNSQKNLSDVASLILLVYSAKPS